MVHFENSSTQVPKPMENPRKKKAQMKTIVRVGSPEENRIRLNKREKSRRKRKKKYQNWRMAKQIKEANYLGHFIRLKSVCPQSPPCQKSGKQNFWSCFLPLNASGRIFREMRDTRWNRLEARLRGFNGISRSGVKISSFEEATCRSAMLAWYWCGSKRLPAIDGSW